MADLKSHYQDLFNQHGKSVKSLQWSNEETQVLRFQELLRPISDEDSVVDIGCGFGDFAAYMRANGRNGKYLGYDFVDEFIQNPNEAFKNDSNVKFEVMDVSSGEYTNEYDWFVASGIFNNKMEDNKAFLENALTKMFNASKKGISFNLLTKYVDFETEGLHYFHPSDVFDFCKKNLSPLVVLNHAYRLKEGIIPFEFTVYVYK